MLEVDELQSEIRFLQRHILIQDARIREQQKEVAELEAQLKDCVKIDTDIIKINAVVSIASILNYSMVDIDDCTCGKDADFILTIDGVECGLCYDCFAKLGKGIIDLMK